MVSLSGSDEVYRRAVSFIEAGASTGSGRVLVSPASCMRRRQQRTEILYK